MVLRAALAVLALVPPFFAGGCGAPRDPVDAALDALVRAADARDARALFERIAPEFSAADGSGQDDARATVERYFAAYETLDVRLEDISIERGGPDTARVRFRARMSGHPRKIGGLEGLVPSSASYDFDLRMANEGGAWKVAWAQWNPAGERGRND
jgi:hypothetical protein